MARIRTEVESESLRRYSGQIALGRISADLIGLTGHQQFRFNRIPELGKAKLNGRKTLIYFWGVWCQPCLEEMPFLSEIAIRYADRVSVIGLSDGYIDRRSYPEKVAEVNRLIAGQALDQQYFTINLDARSQMFQSKAAVLPALAVFDENGKLSYRALGSIVDPEHHRTLVDNLLGTEDDTCGPPKHTESVPANASQTYRKSGMHRQWHHEGHPPESG